MYTSEEHPHMHNSFLTSKMQYTDNSRLAQSALIYFADQNDIIIK